MDLEKLGFTLIVVGVLLALIAVIIPLFTIPFTEGAKISGGGCIVILFIPICFGYGELSLQLVVIAMILAIALIIIYFVAYRTLVAELKSSKAVYV